MLRNYEAINKTTGEVVTAFKCSKEALKGMYAINSDRTAHDLYQQYNNPSAAKRNAWEYCLKLISALDGYNIRVIGNCMTFSVSFLFENVDGKKCVGYITKSQNRFYPAEA